MAKTKPLRSDFDRLVTRRELMAVLDTYHRVYHAPKDAPAPEAGIPVADAPEVPRAPV